MLSTNRLHFLQNWQKELARFKVGGRGAQQLL